MSQCVYCLGEGTHEDFCPVIHTQTSGMAADISAESLRLAVESLADAITEIEKRLRAMEGSMAVIARQGETLWMALSALSMAGRGMNKELSLLLDLGENHQQQLEALWDIHTEELEE